MLYEFIFYNQQLTPEVEGRANKLLGCVTNFDCLGVKSEIFRTIPEQMSMFKVKLYSRAKPLWK